MLMIKKRIALLAVFFAIAPVVVISEPLKNIKIINPLLLGSPLKNITVGPLKPYLLGPSIHYNENCTSEMIMFLEQTLRYGRAVAVSEAFHSCINTAFRGTVNNVGGPYGKCKGDHAYDKSLDQQIAEVLIIAQSSNNLSINCTGGGGNASASIGVFGHTDPEEVTWGNWLSDVVSTLSLPVCIDQAARDRGGCRMAGDPWPYTQAAGIVWHEAMHTHGYGHGDNFDNNNARKACSIADTQQWNFQWNTVPYIVGNCISEVINRSYDRCNKLKNCDNGKLNIIYNFEPSTSTPSIPCTCIDDPRYSHYTSPGGGGNSTPRDLCKNLPSSCWCDSYQRIHCLETHKRDNYNPLE